MSEQFVQKSKSQWVARMLGTVFKEIETPEVLVTSLESFVDEIRKEERAAIVHEMRSRAPGMIPMGEAIVYHLSASVEANNG